jgi:hypothetical protein
MVLFYFMYYSFLKSCYVFFVSIYKYKLSYYFRVTLFVCISKIIFIFSKYVSLFEYIFFLQNSVRKKELLLRENSLQFWQTLYLQLLVILFSF